MLGYLFLGLTLLFYIGLIVLNLSKPLTAQNDMGHGLVLVFLGLGFTISSLILTLCVAGKDGFDWVSTVGFVRIFLIATGWLSLCVTIFFCFALQGEPNKGELAFLLKGLAVIHAQNWLPLLMFVPYFFLLNAETRVSVSSNVYKIPLMCCFAFSFICGMGFLLGFLQDTAKSRVAKTERMSADNKSIHDGHLSFIAAQKPTDGIVNILALTGRFHDADVRLAAVTQVKSHPDWENKLLELLDNNYYHTEVYTFLDGNKVEHPEKFLDPLNRSILRLAAEVRKDIKSANNLQDWYFDRFGIDRLFWAIDEQFANKGMDFRPAVLQLQEALQTPLPEQSKNVRFTITPIVNEWLKKH